MATVRAVGAQSLGCDRCHEAALANTWPPTRRVAVRVGPVFLNVCDYCGAYWEFERGGATVIDESVARKWYPDYFGSKPP